MLENPLTLFIKASHTILGEWGRLLFEEWVNLDEAQVLDIVKKVGGIEHLFTECVQTQNQNRPPCQLGSAT